MPLLSNLSHRVPVLWGIGLGGGTPVSLPVKAVGGLAGVLYPGFELLRRAVFPNSIYLSRETA